ncbi:protein kinase [Achlya hypogyna]|uniref:Protein kinase n=1 Tax=Achlya hypogyna TaxID=1202772 RepID=A0A1V9YJU9_ACHHY|nr:protein kinase [Achlya hypogyna]
MLTNRLFEAIVAGDVADAEKVLAQGANPNATNDAGETPMHVAVRCNQQQVLKLLLQTKSIDATVRNKQGDTPLVAAIKQGHRRFAQLIFIAFMELSHKVTAADIVIDWGSPLGNGEFIHLYKGYIKCQPVVVKTSFLQPGADILVRETKILELCKSPYLLQSMAISSKSLNRPQLVFEYMDGGNLREHLDKKRQGVPVQVEYTLLEVAWVVANALADLHYNRVLHCNLKSQNVLLSSTNYIKVADLGLAQVRGGRMTAGLGTVFWMAPEVLMDVGNYDYAADIYSFGVILSELTTLKRPYEDMEPHWTMNIVAEVCHGTRRPEICNNYPPWIRELATSCMAHNPRERPSAEKILNVLGRQRRLDHTAPAPATTAAPLATYTKATAMFSNCSASSGLSTRSESTEFSIRSVSNMNCLVCDALHPIMAITCSKCGEPTLESGVKLELLYQRIAEASVDTTDIRTTVMCAICHASNFITNSVCDECGFKELPNDDEKLRLVVHSLESLSLTYSARSLSSAVEVVPWVWAGANKGPVRSGQLELLELLLQTTGINTSARNAAGDIPLITAIKQGRHRQFAQHIYAASATLPFEVCIFVLIVAAGDIDVYTQVELGRGGYGMIYMGAYNNQVVAVKTVFHSSDAGGLIDEMKAMQLCQSPYLLQLLAFSGLHSSSPQLVLEYMDGGDLRQYLDNNRKGVQVPVKYSALEVAWVIANALVDLHDNGVLHRDLKSHNVLLSSTNYIKVADLGLARTYGSQMTGGRGTMLWTAPEVLADDGNYGYGADIYSFGVILTELSTLKIPYAGMGLRDWNILDGVRNGTLRPALGDDCPTWLRELATDCMEHDPKKRPCAQTILTRLDHQRSFEATSTTACSTAKYHPRSVIRLNQQDQ